MKPADYKTSDADPDDKASDSSRSSSVLRSWLRWALHPRDASLKEALEEVIEEHEEQADEQLAPEEKVMLHNVLSFRDIKVHDIMVPRSDIIAVPCDITLCNLKAHITEQRHTRIPVYKDTLDNMQGFIHVKDLLPLLSGDQPFDIKPLLRPLLFVPSSMRTIDLLVQMRHAGSHMAIVVDEYGGSDGLVTMEDVVEEIVGDIHDEHDEEEDKNIEARITRISDKIVEVNARIPIEVLERQLGLNLLTTDEGEFDTLAGLIFFQLGRIPSKGEVIPHESGTRFEIIDADPRRIRKVRIVMA